MLHTRKFRLSLILILAALLCIITIMHSQSINAATTQAAVDDPLPSWNDGPVKTALLNFVRVSTDKSNPQYIAPEERIATFDQDGTLWVEQPMYTQVIFAFDRIGEMAAEHPEWKDTEPFKSVINHDKAAMAKFTTKDLEQIMMVTHTGMTVEAFQTLVQDWLARAKNPRWKRPYTDLVYQPMLELLQYLRAHGYKTYIVTGGGQDFVRAYSEKVYGIPPEQVIGSALKTEYVFEKKDHDALLKTTKVLLNDNFADKPEDIYLFIGRRPHAAFGNSIGDQQMLEYTQGNKRSHLMLLVHHDDSKREYNYGDDSKVGTFSPQLMTAAKDSGWIIASIKNDWKQVFAFDK